MPGVHCAQEPEQHIIMTIPFVIDNQHHKMAGALNELLAQHKGHSLDIVTVYELAITDYL